MTPEAYVILPDGTLDPDSAHLIPDDVELVPLTPTQEVGLQLTSEEYLRFYEIIETTDEVIGDLMPLNRQRGFHYARMRISGQSHKMAIMLASRRFPGVKTDSVFNEGKFSGVAGRNHHEELWLRKQAESRGVSTTGKWYSRGLARFPGDPKAWVDGMSDVRRIAAENNMTVHGYVEQKGHEVDPGGDIPIADDLINDEVADILDSNPFANPEQVREDLYRLRTGAVDPNPLLVED